MSETTEQIIKQEFGYSEEAESNLQALSPQVLSPGEWHTFKAKPGRNYMVAVNNMDDAFTANRVAIYHKERNNHVTNLSVAPLRTETAFAEMTTRGIRVYNRSEAGAPGRPRVLVSVYSA